MYHNIEILLVVQSYRERERHMQTCRERERETLSMRNRDTGERDAGR